MGAVYKRKRCCCPLCKPHKRGLEPADKSKHRQQDWISKAEIKELLERRKMDEFYESR